MRTRGAVLGGILLLAAAAWWALGRTRTGEEDPSRPSDGAPAGTAPRAAGDAPRLFGHGARPSPTSAHDVADRPPETGLFGAVVAAEGGRAVPDARVIATRQDGGAPTETRSDSEGGFRLPNAVPGHAYRLVVLKEGFARFVSLRAVPSTEPVRVALEGGGFVVGHVLEDGQAVPFEVIAVRRYFGNEREVDVVRLLAGQTTPDDLHVETRSQGAPDGRFRLGPLPSGDYALIVRAARRPPWIHLAGADTFGSFGGVPVRSGGTTDVGTLALPTVGRVEVRVLDSATNEPVLGAGFEWEAEIDRHLLRFPIETSAQRTDGVYVVPQVLQGGGATSTRLRVSKEGYAPGLASYSGQADGARVEVRLSPPTVVEGVVRGTDGAATPGCRVLVLRAVDEIACGAAVVDDDGRYTIDGLPAGEELDVVVLDAALRRVLTNVAIELTPGERRHLDLGGAGRTGLAGVVRIAGTPIAGALVSFDDADGRRLRAWTAADGGFRFEVAKVGRGELYVSISEPDGGAARKVDLVEGEVSDASIDFALAIHGKATLRDAPPPRYTQFILRRTSPPGENGWRVEARTDADGSFLLRPGSPGVYAVELDDPGYDASPVVVDLSTASEASVAMVLVERTKDGTIVLDVKDASTGQRLPEASYRYSTERSSAAGASDDGVVRLEGLERGRYRIVVLEDLHAPEELTVEIGADTKDVRRDVLLRSSRGVRLLEVESGSNAQTSGLEVGDVLVRYRGARVRTEDALRAAIEATTASERVLVEVRRGGKTLVLAVAGGHLGISVVNTWLEED